MSIVYAGYPAGAALGGIMSAAILETHDWRTVLYLAVLMGLITLTLLIGWLPESIRYLVAKGGRAKALDRLLGQLGVDRANLADSADKGAPAAHRRNSERLLVCVPQRPGTAHIAALRR